MAVKRCPRCGSLFRCEKEKDCWCEQVPVHRARMIEILEQYNDCICPDCLKKYEAKE
jgi:hypothetical protein